MGKRLRREKSICCCVSPRCSFLAPHSTFSWYDDDIWTEIAKYLDGKSLVMLGATSKWFHRIIMDDSIWKFACLRDLQVPEPRQVTFKWIELYASAFDGSHSYMFRQREKHIDWMRIGAFLFDSPVALLMEKMIAPVKIPLEETLEKMLQSCGSCVLSNIKTGIWIADLQLVRCPVCDLNTCDGTMQTLDARHIELFLNEGYKDGIWEYKTIGSHDIKKHADGASGGIFDVKHLKDPSTSEIFDLKSWVGKPNDWQPKAMITLHAAAVNTNLQENEGLHVKYHAMRAGDDGEVVSIRISQQLLSFAIQFPFRLKGQQPQNCGYPGFDLSCNSHGITVLNLPYSGDFFVRSINYHVQEIQLYDPYNCLPVRLLGFNLSGSPFIAAYYQNYTFLSCPSELTRSRFTAIDCLSNSTITTTLATSSMNLATSMTMCKIIFTLPIPVSWPLQYEDGFSSDLNDDLRLTWEIPNCEDCEAQGGTCGFQNNTSQEVICIYDSGTGSGAKGVQVFKIISLSIAIPAITCAFVIAFFIYFTDRTRRSDGTNATQQNFPPATVTLQPAIVTTGLDESIIESYKKVELGESGRLPGPNGNSCPICLSEYSPKETLRYIPDCTHCFHADCIDEWLKMNGTCPVCRNSPSPAHVNLQHV
ncbi:hypothetical protein F0562_014987 [Nyssa sinensis]|uniref:non-specific serine/threonine protein kinase n=1 Tax=Nyssa sinensis TaxID=561372 RepID=A0A5J4ZUD8_9ASTE|nr:hypothetical protein F0562_014987 [Nyssa sinensis]